GAQPTHLFRQQGSERPFRTNKMYADLKLPTGQDGATDFRLWRFVGAHGVECDVDQHGRNEVISLPSQPKHRGPYTCRIWDKHDGAVCVRGNWGTPREKKESKNRESAAWRFAAWNDVVSDWA